MNKNILGDFQICISVPLSRKIQKIDDWFNFPYGNGSGSSNPANNYLFLVTRNTRECCEICSELTIKAPERGR